MESEWKNWSEEWERRGDNGLEPTFAIHVGFSIIFEFQKSSDSTLDEENGVKEKNGQVKYVANFTKRNWKIRFLSSLYWHLFDRTKMK